MRSYHMISAVVILTVPAAGEDNLGAQTICDASCQRRSSGGGARRRTRAVFRRELIGLRASVIIVEADV